MEKKFNWQLLFVKLDRVAAWVLLVVVLLYAITGYGMTKGIIDQQLAYSFHLGWLGGVGLLAFLIHVGWAVHLAFRRWGIWNKMVNFLLLFICVVIVVFFSYLHFIYQPIY